jgi:fatty acid desaturase
MLPEEKRVMDELLSLSKENNDILRSWRRSQRWRAFFSFLWWAAIVALTLWSYYQLQPRIEEWLNYAKVLAPEVGRIQALISR